MRAGSGGPLRARRSCRLSRLSRIAPIAASAGRLKAQSAKGARAPVARNQKAGSAARLEAIASACINRYATPVKNPIESVIVETTDEVCVNHELRHATMASSSVAAASHQNSASDVRSHSAVATSHSSPHVPAGTDASIGSPKISMSKLEINSAPNIATPVPIILSMSYIARTPLTFG